MGHFSFVSGERARKVDELLRDPPPPPKGAHLFFNPAQRIWQVRDENGRVLTQWATKRRAVVDRDRYLRAERQGR
jgi:hypothetical protein